VVLGGWEPLAVAPGGIQTGKGRSMGKGSDRVILLMDRIRHSSGVEHTGRCAIALPPLCRCSSGMLCFRVGGRRAVADNGMCFSNLSPPQDQGALKITPKGMHDTMPFPQVCRD